MDVDRLADLLRDERFEEAADVLARYTVPTVTSLTEDRIGHDLAPDTLRMVAGTFEPAGPRVVVEVDAAYSFLGNARAALLLYVGQPEVPGSRLYDSGGVPEAGVEWYSVGSVCGESAWASTTHRRVVLDVDPARPVTWEVVGAITGGAETVSVAGARSLAITPNGTQAFVTSPSAGTVTPILLGRPGYSIDDGLRVRDDVGMPIEVGSGPMYIAANDAYAAVSHVGATDHAVSVLSVDDRQVVRRIELPGGEPTRPAITSDGRHVIVGTAAGRVARISVASGHVAVLEPGGSIEGAAVTADGTAAYVADSDGHAVHRVRLAEPRLDARIPLSCAPRVVRISPDGNVWVLCRPPEPERGRLLRIDPSADEVVEDHTLPFSRPSDLAIVPVAGQSSDVVRTAWVAFDGGGYCQFMIGGTFAGQAHSLHRGALDGGRDAPSSIAINDYGEIWVTQPELDRVWKWPGGRFVCRADDDRPHSGVFFGEYCDVEIYGAIRRLTS